MPWNERGESSHLHCLEPSSSHHAEETEGTVVGTMAVARLLGGGCRLPRQRTVVVADDDAATVRLVSRVLASAGYGAIETFSGAEALAHLEDGRGDFLIADWEMPGMSGIELCEAIRRDRQSRYVYIILLTARGEVCDLVRGVAAGADDFMSKPLVPGELLARLQAGERVLELQERLAELASHDPLTGLLNRRSMEEILHQEWERSRRTGTRLACVMIDLNYFKVINDEHGHAVGDQLLRHFASILKQGCRSTDRVIRYGGDEFCVFLPGADQGEAAAWAARVHHRLAQTPLELESASIALHASFGVADNSSGAADPQMLVRLADEALLRNKQDGRDRVTRPRVE